MDFSVFQSRDVFLSGNFLTVKKKENLHEICQNMGRILCEKSVYFHRILIFCLNLAHGFQPETETSRETDELDFSEENGESGFSENAAIGSPFDPSEENAGTCFAENAAAG